MSGTRNPGAWVRIAFAMFAVGWGANQFSPMLIVYRHELRLTAGEVAGLFLVYALTLIPGLLVGGPASDRFGRRPVVWPFVALSPLATLLLVLGPRSLAVIAVGRALAGLCSGVVFGAATAWVQEVSPDDGLSARRSALALTAGFGLGPVVAAVLAQWAADPLVVPYLPHLVIGIAAAVVLGGAPATRPARTQVTGRRWPPGAVRNRRFWLAVAPASPLVFGSVALAIVVLPEEVTSARSLSAGFAGLMTALSFAAGVAVQPFARRLRDMLAGTVAYLGFAVPYLAAGLGVPGLRGGRGGGRDRRGSRRRPRAGWPGRGASRPGLRPVPGVGAAAGRAHGQPGRARRRDRLLLRPGLPGLRRALPGRRPRRAGRAERRVHRADRDHRRARVVDRRIRGQPAPGLDGAGR
jgi:MFS family permease